MAVVLTLKVIGLPLFTLIWVPNPRIVVSPAPLTSQSVDGLPGRQFSATIAFAGVVHADAPAAVVKLHDTVLAIAVPVASLIRGSVDPPRSRTLNVDPAGKAKDGVNVAVRVVPL